MRFTIAICLLLSIALVMSTPAADPDSVVPDETFNEDVPEIKEAKTESSHATFNENVPEIKEAKTESSHKAVHKEAKLLVASMKSSGASENACRQVADDLENVVAKNVAALQKAQNEMDKGLDCMKAGQSAVSAATKTLDEAKQAKKDAQVAYEKARDAPVDFGKINLNGITESQCNKLFFQQPAYTKAVAKRNDMKKKLDAADATVKGAEQGLENAKKEAEKAQYKCKCDTHKNHESALSKRNAEAEKANKAGWAKAAHLKCVLDGKAYSHCTVPPMPKVKAVHTQNTKTFHITLKKDTKKCLDVHAGKTSNGNKIQLWDCGATNTNQLFMRTDWEGLKWADKSGTGKANKCIDNSGGGTGNGNKIQIWSCSSTNKNQMWSHSGGALKWKKHTDKCIDTSNAGTKNGNKIQLWKCNGGTAQAWNFKYEKQSLCKGCDQSACDKYDSFISKPMPDWSSGERSWMTLQGSRNCGSGYTFMATSKSNTWNKNQVYKCPSGYYWPTADTYFKWMKAQGGCNGNHAPYAHYGRGGWNGYIPGGGVSGSHDYFRFSDSKSNNKCQHAGQYIGHPCSTSTTSNFAGIICMSNSVNPSQRL